MAKRKERPEHAWEYTTENVRELLDENERLRSSIPWKPGPVPADAPLHSMWLVVHLSEEVPMIVDVGHDTHRVFNPWGGPIPRPHEPGTFGSHHCRITPPAE